jgi:hypothetical protein
MAIIEHEIIINASPDKIYAVSQDYSIRYAIMWFLQIIKIQMYI